MAPRNRLARRTRRARSRRIRSSRSRYRRRPTSRRPSMRPRTHPRSSIQIWGGWTTSLLTVAGQQKSGETRRSAGRSANMKRLEILTPREQDQEHAERKRRQEEWQKKAARKGPPEVRESDATATEFTARHLPQIEPPHPNNQPLSPATRRAFCFVGWRVGAVHAMVARTARRVSLSYSFGFSLGGSAPHRLATRTPHRAALVRRPFGAGWLCSLGITIATRLRDLRIRVHARK